MTVRAVLELPESASDRDVRVAFSSSAPKLQKVLAGVGLRERVLAAAVKAGKFSEDRVAGWRESWQRDPIGVLLATERDEAKDDLGWFPGLPIVRARASSTESLVATGGKKKGEETWFRGAFDGGVQA